MGTTSVERAWISLFLVFLCHALNNASFSFQFSRAINLKRTEESNKQNLKAKTDSHLVASSKFEAPKEQLCIN